MVRRVLLTVGCAAWMVVGVASSVAAQSATRGLSAPMVDVKLTMLPDGSVDVVETITFEFREKTFSEVDREISLRRFDDVIGVQASMDGRPLEEGRGEGQVRVRLRQGRSLRVTWKFPKTIDERHTFTLEYRAMGALALTAGRATLEWWMLPSRHRYPIEAARVEWTIPPGAVRVSGPTLSGPVDDGRWLIESRDDGGVATGSQIGLDESVTLTERFDLSSLAVAMPAWQVNLDRAEQMAPAFIIGAGILLVMGLGVVAMTLFRFHRPRIEHETVIAAPLHSLPPALGTSLLASAVAVSSPQMQAALLDLARRRVLHIREDSDEGAGRGRTRKPAYSIELLERGTLRPHEAVLVDALWLQMKNGVVSMVKARTLLARAMSDFGRAVRSELAQEGFLDADRLAGAKAMTVSGVVVSILGVIGIPVFVLTMGHLGDLPLLIPGAVVVSGVAFLIAGQSMSVLSASGMAASAAWRVRRAQLKKDLAGASWDPGAGKSWWPAAAGFGLTGPMMKAARASGRTDALPEWLSHLDDPSAALTVIVAAAAVHGSPGGAGGGGVAGGGSSGAH